MLFFKTPRKDINAELTENVERVDCRKKMNEGKYRRRKRRNSQYIEYLEMRK
jgi:hypothetical protein